MGLEVGYRKQGEDGVNRYLIIKLNAGDFCERNSESKWSNRNKMWDIYNFKFCSNLIKKGKEKQVEVSLIVYFI